MQCWWLQQQDSGLWLHSVISSDQNGLSDVFHLVLMVIFCGRICLLRVLSRSTDGSWLELASMLRGRLCPDTRSWMGSGLAARLEAVRDQVFSISFELLRVMDIMAEGSVIKKKKKSIL